MILPTNVVLEGDCRDVMTTFPSCSIGLILTSPPYNVGLNYEGYDDNLSDDDFREFNRQWLQEAYRVMMDTGRMYAVVADKMMWWFKEMAENIGWTYVMKLVWCKPNFAGGSGKISNDWNYMTEDIILFRKGGRTPMLSSDISGTWNYFVETTPQTNFKEGRIHPAQMPIKLCLRILSRTPGEPILDPFAGSGQVCRAAKALGRSYIGIELSPIVTERARKFVAGMTPRNYNAKQMDMAIL